ncbi:MAG: guanylate kinase [Deltaproteobacteria bacterium]|nr:guanylate kinase [Deltaproteobacteria bacterium]
MPRRGVPLVVSAPSGCGKTTICQKLLERTQGIEFSISHTTRKPRGSERNGNEYHFISNDEFTQMVKASMFLEWAKVHDNYYGTSRSQAESRLNIGIDVLFDIDVQGGKQLHSCLADVVLVFILPPNLLTLSQRLHNRGTDDEAVIQRRLAVAKQEIEQASFYNYWIINDHLEDAVRDLEAILFAERLRCVDKQAFRQQMLGNINHVDR